MIKMSAHRNIRLLTWFNFFLDFAPYNPIAVIYFSTVTGSFAAGLSILSIVSISSSLCEVPTGIFSDAIGRRKTILLGSMSATLAIVLYAIGGSFWMLAMGAILAGLGQSFFSGNNEALLFETLKEENNQSEYSTYLGRTSSMYQVGLAISAIIGGFAAQHSLSLALWLSVIPQVICIIISFFFVEPKTHEKERANVFHHLGEALRKFRTNKKLRSLSLASIFAFGIGETMHQFGPVFISLLWPIWALGIARMLSHVCAALGFWFSGKIIKRFSALKVLFSGQLFNRAGSMFAYGFPTIFSPILLPVTSFFFAMGHVAQNTLLQEEFSDQQRATMGSLNTFLGNIVFAVFAITFGSVADKIGPGHTLLIGEILLLPILCIYLQVFRHEASA